MKRVGLCLVACSLLSCFAQTHQATTKDQIHDLSKQMMDGLFSIRNVLGAATLRNELNDADLRHKFTEAHHKVNTVLDQVGTMRSLLEQGKQKFDDQIQKVGDAVKKLKAEKKALQDEVTSLKEKLALALKQWEDTTKQLETEKTLAAQRVKEERLAYVETSGNATKELDEKIKEKVTKTVEAEVAAQIQKLASEPRVVSAALGK